MSKKVRAIVTLTYSVKICVEGESLEQIEEWAQQTTPSEAHEECAKQGNIIREDYGENVCPDYGRLGKADLVLDGEV